MNTNYSHLVSFENTKDTVTTIQEPLISLVSRGIPNVVSVGRDFTAMTNCTLTAARSTSVAIFATEETEAVILSTT